MLGGRKGKVSFTGIACSPVHALRQVVTEESSRFSPSPLRTGVCSHIPVYSAVSSWPVQQAAIQWGHRLKISHLHWLLSTVARQATSFYTISSSSLSLQRELPITLKHDIIISIISVQWTWSCREIGHLLHKSTSSANSFLLNKVFKNI